MRTDLTGKKYGKLYVASCYRHVKRGYYWECKCDCGATCYVLSYRLISGHTKSCGCWKNKCCGYSRTEKLYNIWSAMKSRCYNNTYKYYAYYGGRGISICDEWKLNYMEFRKWAIENGYSNGLTIDRIDNNGNYSPSNCRWATRSEQSENRRNNIFINFDGQTYTLTKWSRIFGIPDNTMWYKYHKGEEMAIIAKKAGYNIREQETSQWEKPQ